VKKKHGPAFKAEFRPLTRCPECRGQGETRGIFHNIPCAACGASGLVDKETGSSLTADELVVQLRLRLRRQAEEIKDLRHRLKETEDPGASRGYGPMGMRYHGD